jgi:ornithine cyclodeaminase
MIFLSDDMVAAALPWDALIEALRQGHRQGVDLVERILLSQPSEKSSQSNRFLIWPAWRFDAYCGAKLVTIFPENAAASGRPSNATVYILFDGRDGRPLAIIESSQLTLRKTAADSALGASYLARKNAATLLMVGAGAQARWQIRGLIAARPSLARILIWNRTVDKAVGLARELGSSGLAATAIDDLDAAVPQADIISLATAATKPLLRGALLSPGTHVDLVGGFTPEMREADDDAMRRGVIFVDSRSFTVATCGDLAQPIASGVIAAADVRADLFDLCRGIHPGRRSAEEITLFKNGGGGHLDLMTAVAAYERMRGAGAADSRSGA